jgi:hypothetical protein
MTTNENTSSPVPAIWLWFGGIIALLAGAGLCAANLIFGNLNQDEGWYLYAAKMIASGKMPYHDFAFTQGPAMAYVYALFQPLIEQGGLLAGRLITAVLGLGGTVLAAILAGRLAQPGRKLLTALLCFLLTAVNVYQSYFCVVVKTYSVTILFLAGAFLLLHLGLTRKNRLAVTASAALCVLAASTRTSAAVVLPVIFILLLMEQGKTGFAAWLYFLFGGIVAALLVLGPFLINCPFNFYYFAARYHTLRDEGSLLSMVMFKGGFVSRVIQAYFVCFGVWLAVVGMKLCGTAGTPLPYHDMNSFNGRARASGPAVILRRALWISAIAVSLVHFGAPFPYDDYQAFVYPLFTIVIAVMIPEVLPAYAYRWTLLMVLGLCLASSVSSPVNQDWFIEGRELIWWRFKDKPPIIKLRDAARQINKSCPPGALLLTQDPYLAVESRTVLPHGLEMGQFSYFPDLTNEKAAELNVLNRAMFVELLKSCEAPAAAISGYAFAMQAPAVQPVTAADQALFQSILTSRYDLVSTVPNFGQASTELKLYRQKTDMK